MHLFMIVPGTARAKLHSAGATLHRGPHGRGAQHPIMDHLPLELPGRSLTETGPGAVRLSPKSLPPPIPQFHFAPRIQAEKPSKKFHETTDAQLGVPCVQRSQAASRPRRATQGSLWRRTAQRRYSPRRPLASTAQRTRWVYFPCHTPLVASRSENGQTPLLWRWLITLARPGFSASSLVQLAGMYFSLCTRNRFLFPHFAMRTNKPKSASLRVKQRAIVSRSVSFSEVES